jgi:hypothetical protein
VLGNSSTGVRGKNFFKADTEEKKMASKKKIDANRRNAQGSTGPRTTRGKRTSRQNSLKHGLFSRELHLTDEDRFLFEKLRRELAQQLPSETALEKIALEQVVVCCWRCQIALRVEAQQLDKIISPPAVVQNAVDEPSVDAHMLRWFGSGRADLNAGIRLLAQVRDDIRQHGTVRRCWEDAITACFGADFYQTLTEWSPMNASALQLTNHLISQSEAFDMPLPAGKGGEIFVRDPQQQQQMLLKLVDTSASYLGAAKKISEERTMRASATEANADFAPSYFPAAMRDLQRAVDWLLHLKEEGL